MHTGLQLLQLRVLPLQEHGDEGVGVGVDDVTVLPAPQVIVLVQLVPIPFSSQHKGIPPMHAAASPAFIQVGLQFVQDTFPSTHLQVDDWPYKGITV
ncbi:MAG: hypothetical protein A3B68_07005 [Candidatus Melainabacteria bacterium RIFCSPHIGHO2_02_FULL_34_12]|nr:MAG: hypothetical protein A3B68_07005 [Candidatus Melainabacteria bacterium RIFCSPHIGHO2_02_FULL_34_12]